MNNIHQLRKEPLPSFHLNDDTLGFHAQPQPPFTA